LYFFRNNKYGFYIIPQFLGRYIDIIRVSPKLDFPFFAFLGAWAVPVLNRKRNGIKNNVKEQVYLDVVGLFS
jgi:hypothetical protein